MIPSGLYAAKALRCCSRLALAQPCMGFSLCSGIGFCLSLAFLGSPKTQTILSGKLTSVSGCAGAFEEAKSQGSGNRLVRARAGSEACSTMSTRATAQALVQAVSFRKGLVPHRTIGQNACACDEPLIFGNLHAIGSCLGTFHDSPPEP